MEKVKENIWFPAKKYGWGWGFPIKKQGWCFLIAWSFSLLVGVFYLQSPQSMPILWPFLIAMSVLLVFVCYLKGETPDWRWGK